MQYQEGQHLQGSDGNTYVVSGGVPRLAGAAQPAQPKGPVYGAAPLPKEPTPQTPAQAQYDESNAVYKDYQTRSSPVYDRANAIDKVRDGYRQDKRVLKYEQAIPVYISGLKSEGNPAGDLLLINAFSKVNDPDTGVQQREGDQAAAAQPTTEQLKAQLLKQFGDDGYGNFTPEGRARMREAMSVRMHKLADQYRQARDEQRAYIKSLNLPDTDPETVIGPYAGLPFQKDEAAYIQSQGGTPKMENGQPWPGAAQQDKPGYDQIDFSGKPSPVNPLSKEQQAAYDAFTAANPKATAQQLISFYHGLGLQLDPKSAKAMQEAAAKGLGFAPGADAQYKPDLSQIRPEGTGKDMVLDPALRGAADVATLGFSDELAAGVDTLTNGTPYNQNLAFERGVAEYDTQNNFGPRLGGQLVAGAAMPGFGASSVRGMMGVGAGYGGVYGMGSAEGNFGDRVMGGLGGAAGGAAAGGAIGALSPVVSKGAQGAGRMIAGPTTPKQNALLDAAMQEKVPLNVGDVYPGSRNTIATLETIPGSAGPVQKGIEAGRDAIEGRVQQLGRGGTPRKDVGEMVQDAGERRLAKGKEQANRLYNRARSLSSGVSIEARDASTVLSDLAAREAETPGGTKAGAVIKQYVDDLPAGKQITIDGARRMRSELLSRLRTDGGLTKSEATRVTGKIMDAVSSDINRSLTAAGKASAVDAYKVADKFYAQRMDEVDNVIEKLIGTDSRRKGAGDTLASLNRLAGPKGDARQLMGAMKILSPEERKDLAATLVEPLGRASADESFSPATFIRNVRQLNPAARRIIFGADGEKSIHNLVRISNAKKESVARLNNSRSGQVVNYRTVLSNLIVGLPGGGALVGAGVAMNGATGAAGGLAIGGTILAGSRQLSKALMNEEFTRALANAPATSSPAAINAHMGILRKIGTRDPNVRSVVEGLEKKLVEFANDNVTKKAAASESDKGDDDNK